MHTTFADQLAGFDLAGFSIGPAPVATTDFPCQEAVVQTLEAVWSDLFALVTGTALETDAEDLGWALVNVFHRSAQRKLTALDRATDEVRALIATADGSEIHTHELETQVERAQCAEGAMLALEETPILISNVFEMTPNAMPSAPSTSCAAKPMAMKGSKASSVIAERSMVAIASSKWNDRRHS